MDRVYTIDWGPHAQADWDALYTSAKGMAAFQQSYAYGEMARTMGTAVTRAIIKNGETPVALWQATQKRVAKVAGLTLGMRGPVWLSELNDDEKSTILRQLKHDTKGFTLLMPEEANAFKPQKLRRVMTGYSAVVIDLTQDEDTLLAAQDGKWRNRLRAAQKTDLRIDAMGLKPENYGWLIEEEYEQRQRIGYVALSPLAVPIYQQCAGKKSVLGLQAWQGNERVAGMLFMKHGNSATYHIGWSNDAGKKANAHNLLLWDAITLLKEEGLCWLDLGRVSTTDGEGLTRFKLGSGGKLLTLCGTYF